MEDDVIGADNELLDFGDVVGELESTLMPDLSAKGSLSDVEVDYETRSEISEDDEDNARCSGKTATDLSKKDANHSAEEFGSTKKEKTIPTKLTGRRGDSLIQEKKSDFGINESRRGNKTSKKAAGMSKSKEISEIEDSRLKTFLEDARFFLMKTSDANNLKVSQERQVWFTDLQNVSILNSAVKSFKNVILIFSAKWAGRFSGFALLKGRSTSDDPPRDWAPSIKTLGGLFHVEWLSQKELTFSSSNHLTNPFNGGKLVSICSDGEEIERKVGQELCDLLLHKGVEPKNTVKPQNELLLHKGVEPKNTVKPQNELSIESRRGNKDEHGNSAKSRTSKTSRRESHKRKRSHDRESSTHLRLDVRSYGRIRIHASSGDGLSRHSRSPVMDSKRIEEGSSAPTPNHISLGRRRGSPICRERSPACRGRSPARRKRSLIRHKQGVRKGLSSDRKVRSSIERSLTRERYTTRHESPPGHESNVSLDLRYKTSRGKYHSDDSYGSSSTKRFHSPDGFYNRESDFSLPTRISESDHFDYQSYDSYDDMKESPDPAGMSGRFVIERSPIRHIVANISPEVHTELLSDNYELMSENESDHHVEPSNTGKVVPERYCTIAPSLSVKRSPSPGVEPLSHGTSEAPRMVYETQESLRRPQSRGRSLVSPVEIPSHLSTERSSSYGRSQETCNNKDYPSNESVGRRSPSRGLTEITRDVYLSHKSIGSSQSRSRSQSTLRRSRSRGVSQSTHRDYESHKTTIFSDRRSTCRDYESHEKTRRTSSSRERSLVTRRDYKSYDSTRVTLRAGRSEDTITGYIYHKSTRRSSPHGNKSETSHQYAYDSYEQKVGTYVHSSMRRPRDEISAERSPSLENVFRESKERGSVYDKRSRLRTMGPETRSRYFVPEDNKGSQSRHRSPDMKHKRDSSERWNDRSRRYRDSRSPPNQRRRHTPESRLYLLPAADRAPEAASEYHRYARSGQYDEERYEPTDSGMFRSDAALGRNCEHRKTNHYAQTHQNMLTPVPQYSYHVPTPAASSYLPAAHQNYYSSVPPPVLPPVSSKLLLPVTLTSPPKYNPAVPPPIIPPAPSKYLDEVSYSGPPVPPKYFQGGIPPPPRPHGQSGGRGWVQGQKNVPAPYPSSTQKNLSVEEFLERCKTNKPIRESTSTGSRRRY